MTLVDLHGPDIPFHGVVGPFSYAHADVFRAWIDQGFHGEMAYMARVRERESLEALLPGVRSILAYGFPYPFDRRNALRRPKAEEFKIAQFAHGEDYHKRIRRYLKSKAKELPGQCRIFCDSGQLMEKETARHAGLGFVGRHTLLIRPGFGSAFMLGFILTTAEMEPTPVPQFPGCGRCARCLNVCPTGALVAPRTLDARRCISYATLESKKPEPGPAVRWGYIYGCDLCQAVCPYSARLTAPRPEGSQPLLERVPAERLEHEKSVVRMEKPPLVIEQDGAQFPLNPILADELNAIIGGREGSVAFDGTAFGTQGVVFPSSVQSALTAFFIKTQLLKMNRLFRFDIGR